jgi:hypothetical protein
LLLASINETSSSSAAGYWITPGVGIMCYDENEVKKQR